MTTLVPKETSTYRVFDPVNNTIREVDNADHSHMYEHAPPKQRCFFCSGIKHHHPDCFGQPRMPWGKYSGDRLSNVPADYLGFCISQGFGTEGQRRMLRDEIERRYVGVEL